MVILTILFALGTANFAMHKAVLESGHPILQQVPWLFRLGRGRFSLFLEFVMLLAVMAMANAGSIGWAMTYVAYSMLNGLSVWLILSGRV